MSHYGADLEGRWALVTGSSRGIGQQIAVGLAARGCNVIVHGRSAANADQTLSMLADAGVQTHVVEGALDSTAGVESIVAGVKAGPGAIDVLYNNAAIQNAWKPIFALTAEDWQTVMQVNLYAVIALCTAFAPGMRDRGFGRIVNLTSGIKDIPQLAPYSVSKAAIDKYTQDLAAELRGSNVLVNALDPGWLRTDMGGSGAPGEVESVLPGALVPALLEDNGPTGRIFAAQDYKYLG